MREAGNASHPWWHKLAGWLWLSAWLLTLGLIVSPWRHLGGLVSERLRWLECYALPVPMIIGGCAGRICNRRPHGWLVRRLLLPPAALTAAALVVMRILGLHDPIGLLFTAFMAYWAGLDIAAGAYPLMEGDSRSPPEISPWLGG